VDDAIFPTFIELTRTLKSVRDERLMVGVAHVAAAHVAVAAHLAAVTTMLAAMLARMPAAMTTTVLGGHGVRGGSGGGAAVRVLREGEGAEAQHKNEGQDDSDFISHCSILLVIMIKVLLRLERDRKAFRATQTSSLLAHAFHPSNARAIHGPA